MIEMLEEVLATDNDVYPFEFSLDLLLEGLERRRKGPPQGAPEAKKPKPRLPRDS